VPDALPDVPDVDEDASGPDADVMADACTPACTDKTCGDDGCGGTCGACPDGMECDGTACVANACPPGFARVPSGTFTMGSPPGQPARNVDETLHDVTLTRSFCLAETEVSQDEWKVLLGTNPAWFSSCANCPVERVSWWDAVAYCNALSAKEGLPPCYDVTGCTGSPGGGCPPGATDCLGAYSCLDVAFAGLSCRGYRLPTEAEWEYAAKAGAAADTADGASDPTAPWNCEIPHPALDPVAWFCGNSQWATHGVKGKNTNAWGLYDMLGNVREWCWDSYGAYPAGPVTDPVGPTAGAGRVQRGGRFSDRAANVRAANRYHLAPGITGYTVGLRVARTLP
jgi:formylglycine-generating enzyme required for sulfatase activity